MSKLKPNQNRVIREFEEAVLQLAFIGSAALVDRPIIKEEYNRAKALLKKHLAKAND